MPDSGRQSTLCLVFRMLAGPCDLPQLLTAPEGHCNATCLDIPGQLAATNRQTICERFLCPRVQLLCAPAIPDPAGRFPRRGVPGGSRTIPARQGQLRGGQILERTTHAFEQGDLARLASADDAAAREFGKLAADV